MDILVRESLDRQICFYKRYVDDVLVCVDGSVSVWRILACLNSFNKHIKVTWDQSEDGSRVTFLDLNIWSEASGVENNVQLSFSTFFKPLNCYLFTPWLSNHNTSCLEGIVTTQLIRLLRTNKTQASFESAWAFLRHKFMNRGYPVSVLDRLYAAVRAIGSLTRSKPDFVVPLKLPYFPNVHMLGFSTIMRNSVGSLGFQPVSGSGINNNLYTYKGKTFSFVSCFTSLPNLFRKRFERVV